MIRKILVAAVIIKICAAIFYCFIGFVHPHIIRQNVTIAVNQRYAIDWQHHEKAYPYLPRSLAGGDHDAILEMEFPLLNYLTVPAFYLETPLARTVARLLCLFIGLGFWYWNYRLWRKIEILGISCEIPSLILLLMPISGMYFQRFMPDFLSFILCSTALGYSIRYPKKISTPLILGVLGLLAKPTAIIAFAPLLLLDEPIYQIKKRLLWLVPSTFLAAIFYTKGIKWIRSLSDLDRYYATDFRDPLNSLIEFFSQPISILDILIKELTTPYLPIVILGFWIWKKCPPPNRISFKIWGLLVIQILAIVILDGSHSFIHSYYYVGLSMTAALIWFYYYENLKSFGAAKFLIAAPLLIFNLEHTFYEVRDGFSPRPESATALWNACSELKSRHPDWPWNQGYSFRSENSPISEIGVCFGEIQSSLKNEYGFFWLDQVIPDDCQKVDQEGFVSLVKCQPK